MTDLKEATKYDQDKSRPELIDITFLEGLGRVLAFGARKYADWNWAKGFEWLRVCGSLLRHTYAFLRGEDLDPESGMPHVDHIACNAMFLSAHYHRGLGVDNRFKVKKKELPPIRIGYVGCPGSYATPAPGCTCTSCEILRKSESDDPSFQELNRRTNLGIDPYDTPPAVKDDFNTLADEEQRDFIEKNRLESNWQSIKEAWEEE